MSVSQSVLITGAGGYVGSYITQYALKKNFHVVALDTFVNGKQGILYLADHSHLKVLKKSLFDLEKKDLEGVTRIIHLAAVVGTKLCDENPEKALSVNLDGTKHLCKVAGTVPIYYANTNIGYPTGVSDESAKLVSENVYAKTKIDAENIILDSGGISLRLASVFGVSPMMRHDLLLHYLVREYVSKEELEIFEPEVMRNFVHLKDVSRAFLWNVPYKSGNAYNVCIEKHYRKRTVLDLLQDKFGARRIKNVNSSDPDKRDYLLLTDKIFRDVGFHTSVTVEQRLPSLVRYYEFATL
jgi:nucleoside-diphosphate-sugar epimerase